MSDNVSVCLCLLDMLDKGRKTAEGATGVQQAGTNTDLSAFL